MELRLLVLTVLASFALTCKATPPVVGRTAEDVPKVMAMRKAVKDQLPARIKLEAEYMRERWDVFHVSLPLAVRTKLAETMLPYLKDPGAYVRGEAAFWLGKLGTIQHLEALEKAHATEPEGDNADGWAPMRLAIWQLRFNACLDDEERTNLLAEAFRTRGSPMFNLARHVGNLGVVRCRPELEKFLKDENDEPRKKLIQAALAKIDLREKSLTGEALGALESTERETRMWALQQIGLNRLSGAREALLRVVDIRKGPWPSPEEVTEFRTCLWALVELGVEKDDFTMQIPRG
jgi:hypothetical protein